MRQHHKTRSAFALSTFALIALAISPFATVSAEDAWEKDPAWKPTCVQVGLIQVGGSESPEALTNFCLNGDGNILACFAPSGKIAPAIRVYSPKGELLKALPLEIRPEAICVTKEGTILVAGGGQVLKLDASGKVLASETSSIPDKVTGIAVTAEDIFVAGYGNTRNSGCQVYRLDLALKNPKLVAERLRGCGGTDIQTHDGKLVIAHSGRHTVEIRDRDGKELSKFGTAGKVKAADFNGCCEPKNLRMLTNGEILATQSCTPACIKRFSAEGKFIEVVAVLKEETRCDRLTVEASADGSRFYLLDSDHNAIRVFAPKAGAQ